MTLFSMPVTELAVLTRPTEAHLLISLGCVTQPLNYN